MNYVVLNLGLPLHIVDPGTRTRQVYIGVSLSTEIRVRTQSPSLAISVAIPPKSRMYPLFQFILEDSE